MNLLYGNKEKSSGITITKVNKEQTTSILKPNCVHCEKLEKELNKIIYLKQEIETKYNEAVFNRNVIWKEKEILQKEYSSMGDSNNNLKDAFNLKQYEVKQLEDIIQAMKHKEKEQLVLSQIINQEKIYNESDVITNTKIKEHIEKYGREVCELESKYSQQLIENSKLKKQFEMVKFVNMNLTSDLTKLIEENKELLKKQKDMFIENETYQRKLVFIERQLFEAKTNEQNQTHCNLNLKQELKNKQLKDHSQNVLTSCLEEENLRIKKEYEMIMKGRNEQLDQDEIYHDTMNKMDKKINSLILDNKILYEENAQLKTIMNQYQSKLTEMTTTLITYENENEKERTNQQKEIINQLNNQIEVKDNEIMSLLKQNQFFQLNYNKSIKEYPSQEIQIYKPKDPYNNLIDDMQNKIVELETNNKALAYHNNEIEIMHKSNQELITDLYQKIMNLESSKTESEINITSLQEENCKLNREILALNLKITELSEHNLKLVNESNELLIKVSNQDATLSNTTKTKQTMIQINNTKEQMILNLNNVIMLRDKLIEEKKEYIFEQSKILDDYKENVLKLQNDKDRLLKIIHKKQL